MSADNKTIVRRLIKEVWNKRDLSILDDIVAAHYVRHDPSISHPDGREGFKDYVKSIRSAFPDIEFAIEDLISGRRYGGVPLERARPSSRRVPWGCSDWQAAGGEDQTGGPGMRRRQKMIEDLDQDIRDHIEKETQDNIESGMSPEEARYAALRKFGNVTQVKEETREVWSFGWLEQLGQDIRYGLRQLRRHPGFTAVGVITLALGIGANTAIFSMVNAALLQPLPYKDSQRLVRLEFTEPGSASPVPVESGPDFEDWQKQNGMFEEMAAGFLANKALTGGSEPMQVSGFEVSPQTFHLLGIPPLVGRTFTQEEAQAGRIEW